MKDKKQLTEIWITNLCLTQGIVSALAHVRRVYSDSGVKAEDNAFFLLNDNDSNGDNYSHSYHIAAVTQDGCTSYYYSEENEFFLSELDAKRYAENLRKEKISELEKELERLKNIIF